VTAPGRFITLEGGEGAGKSTQARLLAEALRADGHTVTETREPGGAPGAEALRTLLLHGPTTFTPEAETLLHVAARAEHLARTIRPALAGGQWVVCDRFADSTMAYQGYGLGVDRTMIATLAALLEPKPDLTLMLDVSAATAAARLASRGRAADRYEILDPMFHERVRRGFRTIAATTPDRCITIDGNNPPDAVHTAILAAVRARFLGAAK
jgi:dTMP kinase